MASTNTEVKPTHYSYNGLVFGFDPLNIADAKHVVQHPNDFTQTQCILAFRTIKQARGETLAPEFIAAGLRHALQIGGAS